MMQQPKSAGARRPPRMHLVVLSGVPGSGKSHLTAELQKRGFVVVSQDKLGSRQKCEEEVARCIRENRKCVVDRCGRPRRRRRHSAARVGGDVHASVCVERDAHASARVEGVIHASARAEEDASIPRGALAQATTRTSSGTSGSASPTSTGAS